MIVLLLESPPELAVTVTVKPPAGVPLAGACVFVWLHAGRNTKRARIAQSIISPAMRRRRPPIPTVRNNPGTMIPIPNNSLGKIMEAGVTTGRGVVAMLRTAVAPLVLCNVSAPLGEKPQVEFAGWPVQERFTLPV